MKTVKRTDEERQQALDWLKDKIKPRLKYAKGPVRMTEEQLDSLSLNSDLEDLFRMVWFNWVCDDGDIETPTLCNDCQLIDLVPEYDDEMTASDYERFGYTFVELLKIIYAGQNCGYSFLFYPGAPLEVLCYHFDNECYRSFYSAAKQLGLTDQIFNKAYQEKQKNIC